MLDLLPVIQQGGVVVGILAALSIVATTVILVKCWQFLRCRPLSGRAGSTLIDNCAKGQSASIRVNKHAPQTRLLTHLSTLIKTSALDASELKAEATRFARNLIGELSSYLRILEVIASTAPLLGLFGTVLGMIEAFQAMEAAGSQVNPAVLSGGIWQALLTTAVGLGVAIPVSMINSWLERKVEIHAAILQDSIEQVFTLIADKPATLQSAQPRKAA